MTAAHSDIFIGLMSGTSLDGVDIAIVDFAQRQPKPLLCKTEPYPTTLWKRLQSITQDKTTTIDEICQLDRAVAQFYATVVNQSLASTSLQSDSIEAIGCHGQTVRHSPDSDPAYSLQIGDPNTLTTDTGLTVVADFRRKDIALGGQGAPLAPAFHQAMFQSESCARVMINIGGIANISYLPMQPTAAVMGFDTGPGNTLLDYWIGCQKNLRQDDDGNWAASGQVLGALLDKMLVEEPYFQKKPPKSTGTEYFSPHWLNRFRPENYRSVDIQATLLELTVRTIASAMQELPPAPREYFVCGGGVHNRLLMQRLQQSLATSRLDTTASLSIDPDYVEALAFAWLARETIHQRPGNLPSVTQARTAARLGGIYCGT